MKKSNDKCQMAEVLKEIKAAVENMDVWRKVEQKPPDPPNYECFFCGTEIYTPHEDYCPYGRLLKALKVLEERV